MSVLLINSYGHISVPLFVRRFSSRERRVPLHPFAAELWTRGKVSSFIINFQYKRLKILIKPISIDNLLPKWESIIFLSSAKSFSRRFLKKSSPPSIVSAFGTCSSLIQLPKCKIYGFSQGRNLWFYSLSLDTLEDRKRGANGEIERQAQKSNPSERHSMRKWDVINCSGKCDEAIPPLRLFAFHAKFQTNHFYVNLRTSNF